MGSECNQNRGYYDLSMSRRTRKSSPAITPDHNGHPDQEIPTPKGVEGEAKVDKKIQPQVVEDTICDRRSLKELMKGDEGEKSGKSGGGHHVNSLGQRFMEEEKNLPLVPRQGESTEGSKFAGMVSRYVKVLNHLIKVKRERRRGPRQKVLSSK
ncbi:hypothetical protein H6P81_000905 [Aristolochia fimbriata]|uniref:Uncharacterized protein n=1 Tax=Aristolochia fimbriata TaxID=158543 RepID=A0AAV7F5J8_ARIFI|nr:hypothetical protein H6P81_000905 [Aristolochia fimbriata]